MPHHPLRLGTRFGGLLALLLFVAAAAQPTRYEVQPGSRFWIDGSATTGPYTCEAGAVVGHATVEHDGISAEVRIPVAGFDCGLPPMNRDFRAALQGDRYPTVLFILQDAEVVEPPARAGGWARVRALGTLQLAGATRMVSILAEGRELGGGRVRLRGRHALRMTDFGIEPPTGMLGLVRAHDHIVVRFDVTARER